MIYGAYEVVKRESDSFEEDSSSWSEPEKENLLWTGADRAVLIAQTNEYFARPEKINSYRGIKHEIDPVTGRSPNRYSQGGGCGVNRYLIVKELPSGPPQP